jgi:hypothetical protein
LAAPLTRAARSRPTWGFAAQTLILVLLVHGSDPVLRPAVSSLGPFVRRPPESVRVALETAPA